MEETNGGPEERWLEHLREAPARAEFRARLRAEFLGAPAEGAGSSDSVDVEPGHALERVLSDVRLPEARSEFRASLRARFLGAGAGAAADEGVRPPRGARATSLRWRWLVGSLAAAALVLVLLRPFGARAAAWTIDGTADGVTIDGEALAAGASVAELERLLASASTVGSGEARVRLVRGDEVLVVLEPGSRMRIEPGDPLSLVGEEGRFTVFTGPDYRADRALLRFSTADARVEARGTAFGVDVSSMGTCVCCQKASTYAAPVDVADLDEVLPGRALFVQSGRTPGSEGASEAAPHLERLEELASGMPW